MRVDSFHRLDARWRWAFGSALLALLYYAGARVGLLMQLPGTNTSPFWPASGIALAAVLLFGFRLWPGIAIGAFLANSWTLPPDASGLLASSAISAGNTLEHAAAWLLLRRFVGTESPFERARDVFVFVAITAAACTLAGTIGVTALWSTRIIAPGVYGLAWLTWWLGDTAGILVLTPAIYCWFHPPKRKYSKPQLFELMALATAAVVIAELLFGGWLHSEIADSLPYLVVPVLLWAAFRFGPRETSTVAALSAAIAVVHTWRHMADLHSAQVAAPIFAPFVGPTLPANESLLMLQVFVCAVTVTAVTLSAAIAERARFQEGLIEAEARFRMMFEQAAVGVALIETATGRFVRVNRRYCELVGYTADEMTQMSFQSITHPDDLERDLGNMRRMIASDIREFSLEKRYCRKDGCVIWVNLFVSATWQRYEKPEYHIAVVEDISHRKQAEDALRSANTKLQELSREVIRIRDAERRHLARELHDEIGQNLAALKINMQLLQSSGTLGEQDSRRLDDSIAITGRIIGEVRDLSLTLRPPLLNEVGLAAALRSYVGEQSARSGLPIDFSTSSGIDTAELAPDGALALYRISQEALTNAIRHSQARRISVSLDQLESNIRLVIRDDGLGIRATVSRTDQRPRLGLIGMEERTALLGGEFTVRSFPGAGTVITVQVPLKSSVLASQHLADSN